MKIYIIFKSYNVNFPSIHQFELFENANEMFCYAFQEVEIQFEILTIHLEVGDLLLKELTIDANKRKELRSFNSSSRKILTAMNSFEISGIYVLQERVKQILAFKPNSEYLYINC
jgi:hypothetical protein